MQLKEILENCLIIEISDKNILNLTIKSLSQNTQHVGENSLFICNKGYSFDSHDYVNEVVHDGALAVVVERIPDGIDVPYILVKDTQKAMAQIATTFLNHPSSQLKMIGVTGTNGKTTITHIIDYLIETCDDKSGVIGTMYNKIDQEIVPTVNTTPDSLTLQSILHEMHQADVDVCTMEVSSHGLQLGRSWGVDFDVAVFTNLTQDHLDFHKTMDDYFLAKSLLFSQLGNSYNSSKNKIAVINYDDPYGRKLIPLTAANVLTYGCKGFADVQAKDIKITPAGMTFTLKVFKEEWSVSTKLIGGFNVYNLLAAVTAVYSLGYPLEKIVKAIGGIEGVKGRFEVIPSKKGVTAIVDYAHTPDGLKNVLETANQFAENKVFCVVGSGGDRDKAKRPIMADIALEHADVAIFTSDNPRTEDPDEILKDMVSHLDQDSFILEVDRKKAIYRAVKLADEGDIILVAGKGHENYQIIGKTKHHFDDAEILQEAGEQLS